MKTIAKFSSFVILPAAVFIFFSACSLISTHGGNAPANSSYDRPVTVGTIRSRDITESSGLAASKCQDDVFWTHNDSGDDALIFAINAKGEDLGTWKVPNATNVDWEDIAEAKDARGKCFLYIGEIGDNQRKRAEHAIYRVAEPQVATANRKSSRKEPFLTDNEEILRFTYPDSIQNSETLLVHPKTLDIYVISKRSNGPAGIYRLKPLFNTGNSVKAEKIGEIMVPSIPNGLLTGGDVSPDGKRVILCDYTGAYELTLPENTANFDEIWKQKPEMVEIGDRKQGEGIAYSADGTSIFATSEGKNSPVIEAKRRK